MPAHLSPRKFAVSSSGRTARRALPEALEPRRLLSAAMPQTLEAEQAFLTGAVVSRSHPGFTGGGYVDYQAASGDRVAFAVEAGADGRYALTFRYANGGASPRRLGLEVRGLPAGQVAFAPTLSWRTWSTVTVPVDLTRGVDTVHLVATGQSGPNLDSMSVRAVIPEAATYQAESASLHGAVARADHAGFTGTGFADYQNARGDWVEFPVDVAAGGNYTLDFRYANGGRADRPLELRVDDAVLTGRLSFNPTGGWRNWADAVQPVTLTAGRHTVRLTAVGAGGPNLDALTVRPQRSVPGDVTYLTQSRSIAAALTERYPPMDPSDEEEISVSAGDSGSAPDFGDWDDSVHVQVTPPPGENSGDVLATQRSRLTEAGVEVDGRLDGSTGSAEGTYSANSDAVVTFDLSRPRDYTLTYSIDATPSAFVDYGLSLAAFEGSVAFDVRTGHVEDNFPRTGTLSGRLSAGRYRFVFHNFIGGDVGSHGDYSVRLALNS